MWFLLISKGWSLVSDPTFVASTTWPRLPLFFIQLPIMVSDWPPVPLTHHAYVSAVSIKLNPPARNSSRMANDCCSSRVQPNTLPPRLMGATSKSEVPMRTFLIVHQIYVLLIILYCSCKLIDYPFNCRLEGT